MKSYSSRKEIPEKYKWDLSFLYKDDKEWEEAYNEATEKVDLLTKYSGKINDSDILCEYLDLDLSIGCIIMDLYVYAFTKLDEDLTSSEYQQMLGKADLIDNKYSVAISFFEPEILSLSSEEYAKLFENKKLSKYKKHLDKIYRFKEHTLSKEEEKIVSQLTNNVSSYGNMSSNLLNSCNNYGEVELEDGSKVEVMTTNYRKLMKILPRDKRETVYNQFNKVLDQYASISASLLNNYVKTNETVSKIYKFDSAWERKQFALNLDEKVFNTLVDTVKKCHESIKKCRDVRKKVLKLDDYKPWDQYLELYEIKKEYTIEEAQDLVRKSVEILGEDYVKHYNDLIEKRSVDYCQCKNKSSGGYNVSVLDKKESLIFMSFNEDLDSVSTLAHESGHNVHHQYVFENNDKIYRFVELQVAEVASLTNEILLSNYLINNGTKEEALAGISNLIRVITTNFYSATQEGDLELKFYDYSRKGNALTKEYLNNLCKESFKDFYDIKKLSSEYEALAWVRRSHYYDAFYLFSYAICISAVLYVAGEILKGNKEMLNNYKKFLTLGGNITIEEKFNTLGINLKDAKVYEYADKCFNEYLDKFVELYEEVK